MMKAESPCGPHDAVEKIGSGCFLVGQYSLDGVAGVETSPRRKGKSCARSKSWKRSTAFLIIEYPNIVGR